jgi:hypothetical protein
MGVAERERSVAEIVMGEDDEV